MSEIRLCFGFADSDATGDGDALDSSDAGDMNTKEVCDGTLRYTFHHRSRWEARHE